MTTTQQDTPSTAYRGTVGGHDYVVLAQHGALSARITLIIDGVHHDPAEERTPRTPGAPAFEVREDIGKLICTVRRPAANGQLRAAEQIVVRTAGFTGAGEVDVLGAGEDALSRTPLRPEQGSASWLRDQRRLTHPVRSALSAAAARAATYLVPLLGIGTLLGVLLRPVRERAEPVVGPVRELVASVLDPVRRALAWIGELLLGWVPPLDFPDWVGTVGVPVLVVATVFAVTLLRLRRRGALMDRQES